MFNPSITRENRCPRWLRIKEIGCKKEEVLKEYKALGKKMLSGQTSVFLTAFKSLLNEYRSL